MHVLAENCMLQVNSNGHHSQFLDYITDVRFDDRDIAKTNGYNNTKRGQNKRHETTIGSHFEIKWKDRTKQWVSLSLIKETNPINVAEFVKARCIDDEP